jgi:L-alanine-DL-glutamate epimerase-like enolase superfamily enzyme
MMSNEKPGGHGERSVAVGTIDMAVWDAVAKIAGKPLFRLLAERHGREADPRVFVYAAGGYYYPGKDLSALRAEMRGYLDRGYTVVKMKIGGAPIAEDRGADRGRAEGDRLEARLAVDANGRFDLETAIAYAKMLRDYPLFWYEEAGDPLDFRAAGALAEFYPGPMATGENLFSHQDARNLLRYGGMRPDRDWLQFDCALSTGCANICARSACWRSRLVAVAAAFPHGGHQMSLNIAAGLGLGGNESYPDLFQPYGGFPDGVRVENGHITMPELAGHRLRRQIRPEPAIICGDQCKRLLGIVGPPRCVAQVLKHFGRKSSDIFIVLDDQNAMATAARRRFDIYCGNICMTARKQFRLRQIDRERRALLQSADGDNVAPRLPGEPKGLAKTKTGAFADFLGGVKWLENGRHLVGRDAGAGILDRYGDEFSVTLAADARCRDRIGLL